MMYSGELLASCTLIHDAQVPPALILCSFFSMEFFTSCSTRGPKFPRQRGAYSVSLVYVSMLMVTSSSRVAQSSMQGLGAHQEMHKHALLRGEPDSCSGMIK